jgi:hypothetical protein
MVKLKRKMVPGLNFRSEATQRHSTGAEPVPLICFEHARSAVATPWYISCNIENLFIFCYNFQVIFGELQFAKSNPPIF